MLKIKVELEALHGFLLVCDLFATQQTTMGMTKEIAKDCVLTYEETIIHEGFEYPETVKLAIEIATPFAAELAAKLLFKKLTGKVQKIKIERVEIELDEDKIKRILLERISAEDVPKSNTKNGKGRVP